MAIKNLKMVRKYFRGLLKLENTPPLAKKLKPAKKSVIFILDIFFYK